MIICVYNNKGGVGKTTLSTAVAFRAIEKDFPLVFIDKDKQCNSMKWLSNDTWNGEEYYKKGSVEVTTDFNYLDNSKINIIDAPPEFSFARHINKADIWIVPIKGRFSLDGAVALITELKQSGRENERLVFVSNMTDMNSEIGRKQVEEAKSLGIELYKYAIARSLNFDKAEDMCIPVWDVPYAQRSGAVQALMLFSDWVLKGCPEKGTYGESLKNSSKVGKYVIEE